MLRGDTQVFKRLRQASTEASEVKGGVSPDQAGGSQAAQSLRVLAGTVSSERRFIFGLNRGKLKKEPQAAKDMSCVFHLKSEESLTPGCCISAFMAKL